MFNNLLTESEGSTGKYPTEVLRIDRAIARSIQQDRGWIFSRTARTVEVSKFFIIWHCTFVKKWGKRSREGKVQNPKHLQKKRIVKNVLSVSKTIFYITFYIEY